MKLLLRYFTLAAALTLGLCLLTACTAPADVPAETETETESPSAAESGTDMATAAETEPAAETEDATEPATEAETISREAYVRGEDIVVTPVVTKEQPVDRITIMGHELSEFAVIMADGADGRYVDAANTLNEKFREAVGIDVPVLRESEGTGAYEIVVGTTGRDTDAVRERRNALTPEGYVLYTEGNRLYVTGQDARTTYNGVLSFLDEYIGCRFFTPECQIIHEAGEIAVPDGLDVSFNPTLQYRCSYYSYVDGNVERYYKLHQLTYTGGRVHTLRDLANMQNFKIGDQPCMTDPAVYETVLTNVRKYLERNPNATVISVSQNDSNPGELGCQCDNCKALNEKYGCEGGALFDFVNRIARDIRADYPQVWVETLAYRYSIEPPVNMVFEDNVLVMLCTMELCCNHAIDDPDCAANYAYAGYLEGWSKVCSHLSIWDYHTSFRDYQIPFPNESMLYDQIVYYAKHNAVSLFSEGNYNSRSGQFEEMRSYICSRLMWNIDETKEEYLDSMVDFMKYYYGDGWQYIKRYMDVIEAYAQMDNRHFNLWADAKEAVPITRKSADFPYLAEAFTGLFDKALAAAGTEEQKQHIRKSSIQMYYYITQVTRDRNATKMYNQLMNEFGIANQSETIPFNH